MRTLPYRDYTDPDVLARERERLFRAGVELRRPHRLPTPAPTSRAASPRCRWWSCATGRASCARSSTSAATAAPRSSPAPGRARRCSATTTRGPTASTAHCARRPAPRRRGPRPERARPAPGGRRHLGPVHLRQRRRRRRAARRRRSARCRTSSRERGLDVDDLAVPPPRGLRGRRELEGRDRELPRVLPLRRRPPGLQPRSSTSARTSTSSRATRPSPATTASARGARPRASSTSSGRRSRFNVMPAGWRTSRSGRCGPSRPARTDGFLDYFFAPEASRGVDRDVPRTGRPGRGRGRRARRLRPARAWPRDARGRPPAAPQRAAHRGLPGVGHGGCKVGWCPYRLAPGLSRCQPPPAVAGAGPVAGPSGAAGAMLALQQAGGNQAVSRA